MNQIHELQKIIDESNNIVFFGGAGVSTDSGIKDFRGENGLYKEKFDYPSEYLLSIDCFLNEPNVFYDFYKSKMNSLNIKPNITHEYLTKLESTGKLKAIITQNIDGLHTLAGSKNVLEIHGTIHKNHCTKCNKTYDASYIFNSKEIPTCTCSGIIKPNVVLYGESLPDCFNDAIKYIQEAETLIVAGTSLIVEPASSLVRMFNGKNLIILNKSKTPYDNYAKITIQDNLSKIFKELQ